MPSIIVRTGLAAALLFTVSACTQAPAEVDLKGQNYYGRGITNSYAAAPSGNENYTALPQSTSVQPIGVSDLSPPSRNATKVADVTPFQRAHPETLTPSSGENVNQWTGKPRSQEASQALDEAFAKPVSAGQRQTTSAEKLDSIVGNEEASRKSAIAPTSVKLAKADTSSGITKFMWPVNSKKVISQFGPKGNGKVNDGINIASADGEPVWAAADGEVVYVGNALQGYGNMVLIKHNDNKSTTYAHLSRATVDKYDRVKQGDIIGYVGTSGNVKEPQLHFAIRDGTEPVDPLKYMSSSVASLR